MSYVSKTVWSQFLTFSLVRIGVWYMKHTEVSKSNIHVLLYPPGIECLPWETEEDGKCMQLFNSSDLNYFEAHDFCNQQASGTTMQEWVYIALVQIHLQILMMCSFLMDSYGMKVTDNLIKLYSSSIVCSNTYIKAKGYSQLPAVQSLSMLANSPKNHIFRNCCFWSFTSAHVYWKVMHPIFISNFTLSFYNVKCILYLRTPLTPHPYPLMQVDYFDERNNYRYHIGSNASHCDIVHLFVIFE